jgi:pimeloyl-ACP methyl ester carboxylesterase
MRSESRFPARMDSKPKRWMKRLLAGLTAGVLLLAIVGFTYEQIDRSKDRKLLPPRVGRAVDIGGRSLNLYCSGSGNPAVILETGGGSAGYGWVLVQPKIAAFTRACWYDRAGEGWSDPPPTPRTSATITNDLHEVLRRGLNSPPYVLVGWSFGGELVRVFTAKFPDEIAGLVLVDSGHPDQKEPRSEMSSYNLMSSAEREFLCATWPAMDRFGFLRLMGFFRPQPSPPQLNPEQRRVYSLLRGQRVAFETAAAAGCANTDGGAIVPQIGTGDPEVDNAARASGNLGDRPLIVLTAGRSFTSPDPVAAQEEAAFHDVWVHQLQADLARLSTRGKQVIVENSGHGIVFQAPDAVVSAAQEVVTRIRLAASSDIGIH